MKIEFCGVCDIGKTREVNQDAIFMDAQDDAALFAVADGMGGHAHGEKASAAVVSELREWWEEFLSGRRRGDSAAGFDMAYGSLQDRLELANRKIYSLYNSGEICGSTVAALFLYGEKYCILSSGDSRIYYANRFQWKQLTRDDVWENQPGMLRQYRPAQLRQNANYGKLVHAMGVAREAVYSGRTDVLRADDRFLLCSDGLYKMCSEKELRRILGSYRGDRNGASLLRQAVGKVYEKGAKDNLSCILVYCRK